MANPSVSGYQSQNLNTVVRGMEAFLKRVVTPQIVDVLKAKADEIVAYIDSGAGIPEYLGHLHDATGVGVYADGTLVYYKKPAKHATKLGKAGAEGVNHYQIDGSNFLSEAINEARSKFSKDVWFVIFSAVPYAYYINEDGSPKGRGKNYFDDLANKSVSDILAALRPIADIRTGSSSIDLGAL